MAMQHASTPSPALDIAALQAWQGRSETLHDRITAAPLAALAATLDRDDTLPADGTPLPALWHWLFFLPMAPQHEIGSDGHPRRGGFLPPVPLPRRMWAGGRLQWHSPLAVGDAVRRVSRIESVTHKSGRSGEMVFVLVRHEVHGPGGLALSEEHDIVYRAAAQPGDPAPLPTPAPAPAAFSREVFADPVLLFRYSALTFNGHRIHYDRSYATQEEGYPGLVVHGPLIATLLVDLLRRHHPGRRLERFSFRAVRPTFDQHVMRICGETAAGGDGNAFRLWAQDHEGFLTMQADAELAP
jgi:3-methylfumaryl-CoA hydratase